MTEEVSHASSNPSPNTLSIVNIVCVFVCLSARLYVYVCCMRQRKNTENNDFAGTRCPDRFPCPPYKDKPNSRFPPVFFLRSVVVTFTWCIVCFITLHFSFSAALIGNKQLSHTSVWGVTAVRHWRVTVLFFPSGPSVCPRSCGTSQCQTRYFKICTKLGFKNECLTVCNLAWLFIWSRCAPIQRACVGTPLAAKLGLTNREYSQPNSLATKPRLTNLNVWVAGLHLAVKVLISQHITHYYGYSRGGEGKNKCRRRINKEGKI